MVRESTPVEEQALGLKFTCSLAADVKAPLFLLVHGRAGHCNVMGAFRRCVPKHCHIISPQAPLPDPIGGWSWWQVQSEASITSLALSAADTLRRFLSAVEDTLGIQAEFYAAYGFSQGAGLLSVLVQREPTLFRGVALLAGFVVEIPEAGEELKDGRSQIFIAHGSHDGVVSIETARRGQTYLRARGFQTSFVCDDVAHKVGVGAMKALTAWSASLRGGTH